MLPWTEAKVINEIQVTRNALSTIQTELNDHLMQQGTALGETVTMLKALNTKVDAIKVYADMNDDYVKTHKLIYTCTKP